ncbi:hypothetical protein R3P38DRAFT_3201234 [Favolaschia claudopus]|uniref:C2H2-type domain-containing protein n=1 Tax=Favolaschia claudopus TaxID=2862362 RepID=A0AAW0AXC4_9AGAR
MSTEHSNAASPGGKFRMINALDESDARSISGYSWLKPKAEKPSLTQCPHGPHDDCDCEQPATPTKSEIPITPRLYPVELGSWKSSLSGSPSRRSFDWFERPSADPQVSTSQLPALCTDYDSDDEQFERDRATEALGGEVSLLNSWVEGQRAMPGELTAVPETAFQFAFVPPAGAPKFPAKLAIENAHRPLARSETLILVGGTIQNRIAQHPRPSTDPAHFEEDKALVAQLKNTRTLTETALRGLLLQRSSTTSTTSYRNAPEWMQSSLLPLILKFPFIAADFVTPTHNMHDTADESHRIACPFPDCTHLVEATRASFDMHIKHEHLDDLAAASTTGRSNQRSKCTCPACPTGMLVSSLGRHIVDKHGAGVEAPEFGCKLCQGRFGDLQQYANHFGACQKGYVGEENSRAAKRRRIVDDD